MTVKSTTCAALLILTWSAGPAAAQSGDVPPASTPPPAQIDASKLPVNLARLQQKLRVAAEREQSSAARIHYTIDVFGEAPPLQVLSPKDDLRSGPVPWGAPTHSEMMNAVTPQEYRAPAADFSNLLRWLQNRSKSK
jgi:hypothetical protein